MDTASTVVLYTRIGATVFGRISENRIWDSGIPATRLLLIKFVSRKDSTFPRTSRAIPGQSTNPRIRIIFHSPGSKIAAATSTSRIYGKDITTSVKRIITISATPPKYPAIRPSTTPMAVDSRVAITPTRRETRVAYKSLLNTSRPMASVPRKNSFDGAAPKGPAIACGS